MRTAPLETSSARAFSTRSAALLPSTAAAPRTTSVLVVEDDPDQQWRLARMLTLGGHRVVGTSTGEGALALVAQWPVDLVLINDALAGGSGLALASRLRKANPRIKVVLMTDENPADRQNAIAGSGVARCVSKPLAQQDVERALRAVRVDRS